MRPIASIRVFCGKILEKDPGKRYQTAAEFITDLRAVERHAATVNFFEGRIEIYLRAHFPLIYLQTFEEQRALQSLLRVREAIAVNKDIGLFVGSATCGLRDREGRVLVAPHRDGNPTQALEQIFSGLGQAQDNGVTQRLFGTFLTWLEDRDAPVFVTATANDIRRLPPEFTRKGRFDEVFCIDLPHAPERERIFRVHIAKLGRSG